MIRLSMILGLLLAVSSAAQEEVDNEPDAAPVESADDGLEESVELDELDINTDHTDEDEDIFVPSEDVSYQQSIPFPTDI